MPRETNPFAVEATPCIDRSVEKHLPPLKKFHYSPSPENRVGKLVHNRVLYSGYNFCGWGKFPSSGKVTAMLRQNAQKKKVCCSFVTRCRPNLVGRIQSYFQRSFHSLLGAADLKPGFVQTQKWLRSIVLEFLQLQLVRKPRVLVLRFLSIRLVLSRGCLRSWGFFFFFKQSYAASALPLGSFGHIRN